MNRSVSLNGEVTTAIEVSSTTGRYSDQSFTLLMNQDPEVKPSEMSGLANDLNAFEARMLGRAHDLEGEFDDAATEFTEIIKWDISTLNAEDLATWMEATSSIRFCAAITEEWSDYVKEYKQERLRIINRWNEEAPGLAEGLDEDPPSFSFMWEASPAEEAEAALAALKTELQGQEETAFQTLDTRGSELSEDLSNGPTPESVQRLISEGYITWSYFNLGGDVEAMPIDADPEEMADDLVDYLDDPEGYEGDISEIIVLLNNMGVVAMERQGNGGTLSSEEMEFLTTFYESLEEAGDRHPMSSGVLTIANLIEQQEGISDDVSEQLLGALGNGVLVLSDEGLRGGYGHLPASIREVVEGFGNSSEHIEQGWYEDASVLAAMMGNTITDLEGGEQFSVNLTQTLAHALDTATPEEEVPMTSEQLERLIDVSTRNEDANHAILTGKGAYEHPVHGLNTDMTLRGLYTHEWPDESDAITGLTDWIYEWSESADETQKTLAAEAAIGLIESLTGEIEDDLRGTGVEVGDNPDASFTEVNPSVAESLTKVYFSYIDSFGLPPRSPEGLNFIEGDNAPAGMQEGDIALGIPMDSRQDFLQFLLANEDIAPNLMAVTLEHQEEILAEYLVNGGGQWPSSYGQAAGTQLDLIESALLSEYEDRLESAENWEKEAEAEIKKKWETAYKTVAAVAAAGAGGVNVPLGMGVSAVGVIFEEPMKDFIAEYAENAVEPLSTPGEPTLLMHRDGDVKSHVSIMMANILVENEIVDMQPFIDAGVAVELEDGTYRLPEHQGEWGIEAFGNIEELDLVLENTESWDLEGVDGDLKSFIDAYVEGIDDRKSEKE